MKAWKARAAAASLAAAVLIGVAQAGCRSDDVTLTPPDPNGSDLVAGAVVAAVESTGGVRVYKIVHVDDYPEPIGWELHMMAFDPKAATFEEAARLWKGKTMKVTYDHILVRLVHFGKRDRRVVAVEPVTPEEKATYLKYRR